MNLKYYIAEIYIKCPYCNEIYEDDDCLVQIDEKCQLECANCDKHFWAEAKISYDTNSDCSLNSVDHEWYNSESHPTVYNCKNCSQYKVESSNLRGTDRQVAHS